MKAIVYKGAGQIAVKDVPMPKVPEGWALVKVSHAGICGTDLNIYGGTHPRAKAPLVIGHEFSGEMAQDAPGLPKGTRVTVYPLLSCGNCEPCKTGNTHVCNTLGLLGIDCDGGMAEYVACPVDKIIPVPDMVSDKVAAFVEPIAVAVHALRETGFVPGDNAIVLGAGTIGIATAITLRKFGASKVIISETDETRASLAASLGFQVIDPASTDMSNFGRENLKAGGFDWVYDCAGVQAVADTLLDLVKVRGHIVIIASYKKPAAMPLFKGMAKETDFRFCRVYRQKDFEIAVTMAQDPDYEKIITHVLPVEDAQKGFDLLFTKGTGAVKVMFRF
ncbi:MAG: alcohol dehydrogenase catalytic domain-containing protein [Lachnospiraceae bacterium]|jgi:(R,R)-butanediol dehydrogenase/meso-butanediol dehydrogenase/diacetyl reductase|nr:alcohol dehydrogenase catalytic domain-containing protein [Lachnospiraceae bacterium]